MSPAANPDAGATTQESPMRIKASVLLAAFAFAATAMAQTEAQPAKATEPTEKLWKIEASGISG